MDNDGPPRTVNSNSIPDFRHHKFYRLIYNPILFHPYRDDLCALHGSVLVKGGSVISWALNEPTRCGMSNYYATHDGFVQHSELLAIKKVRKKIDLRNCVMYNLRIDKNGGIKMSKPCAGCQHLLCDYGIQKCYYSTEEQTIEVIKFSSIRHQLEAA